MKRSLVTLAALSFLLTSGGLAWANDSSFGGSGGSLYPRKEARVSMVSEDIEMEIVETTRKGAKGKEWRVEATYVFVNRSRRAVKLQVGFPEMPCAGDSPCPTGSKYSFHDLVTTVRGKKVKTRLGKLKKSIPEWSPDMGRVHLFDVTFKAGEKVKITHSFRHELSGSVEGHEANYVTTTGALWRGPIGRARFTVRVPWRHHYTAYPPEYKLLKRSETMRAGQRIWTLVFEQKRWTPKRDFYVAFGNFVERLPSQCPHYGEVRASLEAQKAAMAKASKTVSREELHKKVAAELFAKLDKKQLRVCRNWPWAFHGYPFKSKDLRDYYYGRPFIAHCPFCGPREKGSDEPGFTRFFYRRNPTWSKKLLSAEDLRYARIVRAAEKAND